MTDQEKQGNFKALFIKLSGATLGLVGMMSAAVYLGPMVLSHDNEQFRSANEYGLTSQIEAEAEAAAQIAKVSRVTHDRQMEIDLANNFKEVVEVHQWQAEKALEQARKSLEDMSSERFEALLYVQNEKINALVEAITEISEEEAIPGTLKKTMVEELQRQIHDLQKKIADTQQRVHLSQEQLSMLEDHVVTFAYNDFDNKVFPNSTFKKSSKCSEEEVTIGHPKSTPAPNSDSRTGDEERQNDRKGSLEAFYWI